MRFPTENLGALAPYLKDVLASGVLPWANYAQRHEERTAPHPCTWAVFYSVGAVQRMAW